MGWAIRHPCVFKGNERWCATSRLGTIWPKCSQTLRQCPTDRLKWYTPGILRVPFETDPSNMRVVQGFANVEDWRRVA